MKTGFQLSAPNSPQAQRFAFAVLKHAAYHVSSMADFDSFNVLESCATLVKWGTLEQETFKWGEP